MNGDWNPKSSYTSVRRLTCAVKLVSLLLAAGSVGGCVQSMATNMVKEMGIYNDARTEMSATSKLLREGEIPAQWQQSISTLELDEMTPLPGGRMLVGLLDMSTDYGVPSHGPYVLVDERSGAELWRAKRDDDPNMGYEVLATDPVILVAQTEATETHTTYFALDPESGKELWDYKANAAHAMALDSVRAQLLLAEASGRQAGLMALDLHSGKKRWGTELAVEDETIPALTIAKDVVWLISKHATAFALNDGSSRGSLADIGPTPVDSQVLVLAGGLVITAVDGRLSRISRDGKLLWQVQLDGVAAQLASDDKRVFAQLVRGDKSDQLVAVAADNGRQLWSRDTKGRLMSALLESSGRLLATWQSADKTSSTLQFRNARDGKLLVSSPVEGAAKRLPDIIRVEGNGVVVAQESGIAGYAISDGRRLWSHSVSSWLTYANYLNEYADFWKEQSGKDISAEQPDSRFYSDFRQSGTRTVYGGSAGIAFERAYQQYEGSMAVNRATMAMLDVREAMDRAYKQAPIKAKLRRMPLAYNLVVKAHRQAIQGNYFVRAYRLAGVSAPRWGVVVVDMRDGRWIDISTSPDVTAYAMNGDYQGFLTQLPRINTEGDRLLVKGVGLDPSVWKPVQLGISATVAQPSLLGYRLADADFKSADMVYHIGGYGYLSTAGHMAIASRFSNAKSFSDGLAAVEVNGKWGYIDRKGKQVIAARYDDAQGFHEGLAAVKSDELWGFIDKRGRQVIKPQFIEVQGFAEGFAPVQLQGQRLGYVDRQGHLVISAAFGCISQFHEGLARIAIDPVRTEILDKNRIVGDCEDFGEAHFGFIDKTGHMVIQANYMEANHFYEGMALVMNAEKQWVFIDHSDKTVLTAKKGQVFEPSRMWLPDQDGFSEGLFRQTGATKGYVDKSGTQVISLDKSIECYTSFSEGLARASNDAFICSPSKGAWGYLDKSGNYVIPPRYTRIQDFVGELALVKDENGLFGYIDKQGSFVIEPKYNKAESFSDGLGMVFVPGKKWYRGM